MLFQQPFSSLVSSRDLLEVSTVLFASTVWMCRFAVTRSGALFSDHYVPLRCHFLGCFKQLVPHRGTPTQCRHPSPLGVH